MSFSAEGFLSKEVANWTNKTRKKYAPIFGLADDINLLVNRTIHRLRGTRENERTVAITALYLRAVQAYQGVIVLAEKGMIADSRSLLRNVCETTIKMGAIAKDASYVQALYDGDHTHRVTLGKSLIDPKFIEEFGGGEHVEQISAAVAKIEAERAGGKVAKTSLETMATFAGLQSLYNTVFRGTSGDAAHATLGAIERHLGGDSNISGLEFLFAPSEEDLENTLHASVFTMLQTVGVLLTVFQQSQSAIETEQLQNRYVEYLKELDSSRNQMSQK
jgi:hypothetical protein